MFAALGSSHLKQNLFEREYCNYGRKAEGGTSIIVEGCEVLRYPTFIFLNIVLSLCVSVASTNLSFSGTLWLPVTAEAVQ